MKKIRNGELVSCQLWLVVPAWSTVLRRAVRLWDSRKEHCYRLVMPALGPGWRRTASILDLFFFFFDLYSNKYLLNECFLNLHISHFYYNVFSHSSQKMVYWSRIMMYTISMWYLIFGDHVVALVISEWVFQGRILLKYMIKYFHDWPWLIGWYLYTPKLIGHLGTHIYFGFWTSSVYNNFSGKRSSREDIWGKLIKPHRWTRLGTQWLIFHWNTHIHSMRY